MIELWWVAGGAVSGLVAGAGAGWLVCSWRERRDLPSILQRFERGNDERVAGDPRA